MNEKSLQLNPLHRSDGHDVENERVVTLGKPRVKNDTKNSLARLQQRKVFQKGAGGSPLASGAKKMNFNRHNIRIAVAGTILGIILLVSSVILSVTWTVLDRSSSQQTFHLLLDTSRLTMERLEVVTSDTDGLLP